MLRARQSKRRHPQHRKPDASEMLDETPEEAAERATRITNDILGDPMSGPWVNPRRADQATADPSDPDAE